MKTLPDEMDFLVQSTTRMTALSVPEPDLAVLWGKVDELEDVPTGHNLALVIEVSDSTLSNDRSSKARIYAEAGVPEYWIVNLVARAIEVHREPVGDGYRLIRRYGSTEEVAPAFGGAPAFVSDLLPRQ